MAHRFAARQTGLHIPEAHHMIRGSSRQQLSVRAEPDKVQLVRMCAEEAHPRLAGKLPKPNGMITRPGDDPVAVGAKRQHVNVVRLLKGPTDTSSGTGFPELHRPVS